MLELAVRIMAVIGVRVRVRELGYKTRGYEKGRVRNVWKPHVLYMYLS